MLNIYGEFLGVTMLFMIIKWFGTLTITSYKISWTDLLLSNNSSWALQLKFEDPSFAGGQIVRQLIMTIVQVQT